METTNVLINGNQFYASADKALLPYAQLLFGALKNIPEHQIRDGYRIEIGFSLFTCLQVEGGYRIVAPHYTVDPFRNTTEDLTLALWILYQQAGLLKKCNLGGVATRFDDGIVVAKGALDSPTVSLQRYDDLGKGASGWCVEAVEESADATPQTVAAEGYESLYAYQLLQLRPALLKVLVLPYHYLVVMDDEQIHAILNEKNENIWE